MFAGHCAHTKGGHTKFSNFLLCRKKNFWSKRAMADWPRGKYATASNRVVSDKC